MVVSTCVAASWHLLQISMSKLGLGVRVASSSLRGPPLSLVPFLESRLRNWHPTTVQLQILNSRRAFSTSEAESQSCAVTSRPQEQTTYRIKPIPLRCRNQRHIAIPVTMPPKPRKYQKQASISKSAIPRLLHLSAAIIPLGSILSLHFSIHNSLPLQIYTAMSILSFCLYGFDKYRASTSGWRLRENMLHVFDLLGGWPGGYVAQQFFHHKTWKKSFQAIFWATVLLHNAVWVWLYIA